MVAAAAGHKAPAERQTPPAGAREPRTGSPGPPYSVRDAAALLGVSQDAVEANYRQLDGFRVGRRILIPRRVVDGLAGTSCGAVDEPDESGRDRVQAPPLERVLALLPLLAPEERVRVAQVALSGPAG
jgi:hypothetical protein